MFRLFHTVGRLFLMATVFAIAFSMTPRVLVEDQTLDGPTEQIPVDKLDSSESCLWCDSAASAGSSPCGAEDDEQMWLNPDQPRPSDDDCEDEADPTS